MSDKATPKRRKRFLSDFWWRVYFSASLRWKLIVPTLGLTLVVIALLTWFAASMVGSTVTDIYTQKARAVAALVSKAIVDKEYILYYSDKLNQDVSRLVQFYPDVYRITIYGKVRDNVRVITSSDPTLIGEEVALEKMPEMFSKQARMALKQEGSRSFFEVGYPLYQDAEIIGVAQVDLSLAERDHFLQGIYFRFVWGGLVGFVALGGLLYVTLRLMVSAPVYRLSQASEKISKGDYDAQVTYGPSSLRVTVRDELSRLMNTFNAMTSSIREKEQRLKALIVEDQLTGSYNRQHFDHMAKTEIERASRYAGLVSFLLVDIRGLDAINHTFGQSKGDQVLKTVAALLHHTFRQVDPVFRYGGDEFIIIMPETDEEGLHRAVQRLENALRALNEEHDDVRIGLDMGYTTWVHNPKLGWRIDKDGELIDVLSRASTMLKGHKRG